MIVSTVSLEIERPAAEVFPLVIEPDRIRQWVEGVIESVPLTEGPPRVGWRSRQVVSDGGRRAEVVVEITALEVDRFLEIRVEGDEFQATARYRFEELDGRTRIDYTAETRLKGMYKLMAPVLKRTIQEKTDHNFARLKRLAET